MQPSEDHPALRPSPNISYVVRGLNNNGVTFFKYKKYSKWQFRDEGDYVKWVFMSDVHLERSLIPPHFGDFSSI